MDGKHEISLLYDFYKELLNDSQQQVVELYINDDLSLSEVAEILGISRQGVRDSLNRASKKLRDYENKLHMLADYQARYASINDILDDVEKILGMSDDPRIAAICKKITNNINDTIKTVEREERYGV